MISAHVPAVAGPPARRVRRAPELFAWLAAAASLVAVCSGLAAPSHPPAGQLVAAVSPEQATAWIQTGCAGLLLIISTALTAAHRIADWRAARLRHPRHRKPRRPAREARPAVAESKPGD